MERVRGRENIEDTQANTRKTTSQLDRKRDDRKARPLSR